MYKNSQPRTTFIIKAHLCRTIAFLGLFIVIALATTIVDTMRAKSVTDFSSVDDFGAIGDGYADDTEAFDHYTYAVRGQQAQGRSGHALRLGLGKHYLVHRPVNFTGLSEFDINLNGSTITGIGQLYSTLDLLGSQRFNLHNGRITCGNQETPCLNGIQVGRYTTKQGYNENSISDVIVEGYFTQAALFNNSETLSVRALRLINRLTTGQDSYGLIQDGMQHFPINSDYVTPTYRPNSSVSFNENTFTDLVINSAGGPGIWLGSTRKHYFRGYIQSAPGKPSVVIWDGGVGNAMVDFDVHFEQHPGSIFKICGPDPKPTIFGLRYRDQLNQSTQNVFEVADNILSVKVIGLDLEIANFLDSNQVIFEKPSIWTISGHVVLPSGSESRLNNIDLAGYKDIGGQVSFANSSK